MKRGWGFTVYFAALALCVASYGVAQKLPWQDSDEASGGKAPAVVQFLGPEQVSISARSPQDLLLHFRVAPGYHINSHAPHGQTLIPTQLVLAEGSGLDITGVDFPPGTDTSLPFSPSEKLSVYTGDIVLHAHVKAQPGTQLLQGALRYQACDVNACMPPKKIPVAVSVLAR